MKELPLNYSKYRDIFLKEDPMGIYFDDLKNIDEYDPEINLYLTKIEEPKTQEEIHELILQVFVLKFGNLPDNCKEKLHPLSKKLFEFQRND
jgi:hypothetical protein